MTRRFELWALVVVLALCGGLAMHRGEELERSPSGIDESLRWMPRGLDTVAVTRGPFVTLVNNADYQGLERDPDKVASLAVTLASHSLKALPSLRGLSYVVSGTRRAPRGDPDDLAICVFEDNLPRTIDTSIEAYDGVQAHHPRRVYFLTVGPRTVVISTDEGLLRAAVARASAPSTLELPRWAPTLDRTTRFQMVYVPDKSIVLRMVGPFAAGLGPSYLGPPGCFGLRCTGPHEYISSVARFHSLQDKGAEHDGKTLDVPAHFICLYYEISRVCGYWVDTF